MVHSTHRSPEGATAQPAPGSSGSAGPAKTSAADTRLPIGQTIVFGFQHVLVMYAGTVVVPLLIGHALHFTPTQIAALVSIDLVLTGVATIMQSIGVWKFGIRLPLIVGVASQGIAPVIMVGKDQGLSTVLGSALVAGAVWLLAAPFFGTIVRFFPHVVTGTVILLIGLTLIPVGLDMIAGSDPDAPSYGRLTGLGLGGLTLLLMAIFYRVLRGFLGQLSVLLAIVVATIVGWAFHPSALSGIGSGPPVAFVAPFHFGGLHFHIPSILIFLLVIFVLTVEASGQGVACGEVVGAQITGKDLTRLLRVDATATIISSFFFGFLYTTFGQNIGLLKLTGVRSRFPVAAGGAVLILLGVFHPVSQVMAAIPDPVVGAAAAATFGVLVVSGIEILQKVNFNRPGNMLIVLFGVVFGLIPVAAPNFYQHMPNFLGETVLHSGLVTGTIVAIALNLLFNVGRKRDQDSTDHSPGRTDPDDGPAVAEQMSTSVEHEPFDAESIPTPVGGE